MNGTENNLNCGVGNLERRKQNLAILTAHSGWASDNPEGAAQSPPELFSNVTICLRVNFKQIHQPERKWIFFNFGEKKSSASSSRSIRFFRVRRNSISKPRRAQAAILFIPSPIGWRKNKDRRNDCSLRRRLRFPYVQTGHRNAKFSNLRANLKCRPKLSQPPCLRENKTAGTISHSGGCYVDSGDGGHLLIVLCFDLNHRPVRMETVHPSHFFPHIAISDMVELHGLYCVEPPMARMRTL
jgi:hypothetical protein